MQFNLRFWIGVLGTIGFVTLFLWKIDFHQTGEELLGADYGYVMPAVLIYFCSLGFRSIRWHFLLLHLKPISPMRLYPVVTIGYLANNVLPVRLGELVRSHFLGEREGISKTSAIATIAVERVMDGVTLILIGFIIMLFVPNPTSLFSEGNDLRVFWISMGIIVSVGFVLGFGMLLVLALSPKIGLHTYRFFAQVLPEKLQLRLEGFVLLLMDGLGALRSPYKLLIISVLSVPVWMAEALAYYIMAMSFDLGVSFQVITLVTITSNLATAIPSTIGGIGPFEVVAKATLIGFGVGSEAATAYAFSVHIIALWLPVNILGLLFLGRENLSIFQASKDNPLKSRPQRHAKPSHEFDEGNNLTGESKGK